MHKSGRIIYSILFLTLWVSGCSARQSQFASGVTPTFNPITIGYSAPTQDVAQIVIMNSFTNQAKSLGWKVVTAKDNRDPVIQASQIDYLISLGVNAIVAVPEDSTKICESVKKAHAAGIPFYTIDRAPLGCEVNMTVLADNRMAGHQAGEAMVNLLKQRYGDPKGIVLELQGDLRQNVAQLRGQGFHEVIDPYRAVEVISKPTEWQASQVTRAVQKIVSTRPVDGIFLHSDCVDISVVLPILDKLGKKIAAGLERVISLSPV